MKKKITVFVFFIFLNAFTQTRQETETWLLSKLNLYTAKEHKDNKAHYGYSESKKTFSFDGTYFTYSYNYYESNSGSMTYRIPLWAIENVTLHTGGTLIFKLESYCKSCYSEHKWQEQKRKFVDYYKEPMFPGQKKIKKTKFVNDGFIEKSSSSSTVQYFEIKGFLYNPEEDFIARFNKAIMHLQSLYPKKPQKTETF